MSNTVLVALNRKDVVVDVTNQLPSRYKGCLIPLVFTFILFKKNHSESKHLRYQHQLNKQQNNANKAYLLVDKIKKMEQRK